MALVWRLNPFTGTLDQLDVTAAGEANTASNINVGGVGVWDQKVGVDLQFRGIAADSARILVALDAPNNEIGLDVSEANLDITNLGGTLPIASTSGILAVARGGSAADLSGQGGANQFVRQSGVGAAFTVSALALGDLPAGIDAETLDTLDSTDFFILGGQAGGQIAHGGTNNGDHLDFNTHTAGWLPTNAGRIRLLERQRLFLNNGTITVGNTNVIGWEDVSTYTFDQQFSFYTAFKLGGVYRYEITPFILGSNLFFMHGLAQLQASANVILGGMPLFLNQIQYNHGNWVMDIADFNGGFVDAPAFLPTGTGNFGGATTVYNSFRAGPVFGDDFNTYHGFRFNPPLGAGDVTEVNALTCDDYGFAAGVDPDPSTHVRRSLYSPGPNASLLQTGPSLLKIPSHNRVWELWPRWSIGVGGSGVLAIDFDPRCISINRFGIISAISALLEDATGVYADYQTGAVLNADALISTGGGITLTRRDYEPTFVVVCKTGAAITTTRHWIGMFSAAPFGGATPAVHYAAFRYDTGADGTAFWRCVTDSGTGAPTVTVTVAAVTVDTRYRFTIALTSSSAYFYINGLLVATHTATLPGAATNLGIWSGVRTLAAVNRSLRHGGYLMQESI